MDIEAYHSVILLLWVVCFVLLFREYKIAKELPASSDKNYWYAMLFILAFGVFVRSIWPSYPFGLYSDEAIGGYDAWSLANYGVDGHLASYPVYFKSWGTGQSALYAYLAVPFIKLFGLSEVTFRLPMIITSSAALFSIYYALKKTKVAYAMQFIVLMMFVISPWHWMMSRWALDCNLCPNLLIIATSLIIIVCYEESSYRRFVYALVASLLIALSAYAYGVSWFMLPLFCILIYGFLLKNKKLSVPQIAICGTLMLIVLIPLICFACVMFFDLEEFKLGFMTITKLDGDRASSTTVLGGMSVLSYLKRGIMFLITGDDSFRWNSFFLWGQFYNIIGLPFIIYTFCNYVKTKKLGDIDKIFLIWFASTILIFILVEPNTNHWNLIWPPLLFFFGKGIYLFTSWFVKWRKLIYSGFFMLGLFFGAYYFMYYSQSSFAKRNYNGFVKGLEEIAKFTDQLDVDTVYNVHVPAYPQILFYTPMNPYEYVEKKRRVGEGYSGSGDYGKHYFKTPFVLRPTSRVAYVVSNIAMDEVNETQYKIFRGDYFSVLWND